MTYDIAISILFAFASIQPEAFADATLIFLSLFTYYYAVSLLQARYDVIAADADTPAGRCHAIAVIFFLLLPLRHVFFSVFAAFAFDIDAY